MNYLHEHNPYEMVYVISSIKIKRMKSDYNRLGLDENSNIYHYITRDAALVIQECTYPLIELNKITNINRTDSSITWTDGIKNYKFTFETPKFSNILVIVGILQF